MSTESEKFEYIFRGLELAHGTYSINGNRNGKQTGKAQIVRTPRTTKLWEEHLSGEGVAIGIIPINEESQCVWGCIDVDEYTGLDHEALVKKIRRLKLPLVVCRSKSGGAHIFLFTKDWLTAKDMQETLKNMASALGYNGSEIFPKQVYLNVEKGDTGNFLNLPYFNAESGMRYVIQDDGTAGTLQEFFALYEKYAQEPDTVSCFEIEQEPDADFKDVPPCLQALFKQGFEEGSRNNGLFNVGVYLRKAFPKTWSQEIQKYNTKYFDPPLGLSELNLIAKQLEKKDYTYKCSDQPIKNFCNKELCATRKYGVQSLVTNTAVGNLRKYNSNPPLWFLDVNSHPVELDTEGLMFQPKFQKACIEQLNYIPPSVSKPQWETRLNGLLSNMTETEGSIMEASEDSNIDGQFYEYLEEFAHHLQKAESRDEIYLRRAWTDEEKAKTYFRIKDLMNHLKKNKFYEYKLHQVAQRLKDIGGEACQLKVKGKSLRVWGIPAQFEEDLKVEPKSFKEDEKKPF